MPIVGVGGVANGKDVLDKLQVIVSCCASIVLVRHCVYMLCVFKCIVCVCGRELHQPFFLSGLELSVYSHYLLILTENSR